MANRWLFVGGDVYSMRNLGSPFMTTTTSSNQRNTTYCDAAISLDTYGVYADFADGSNAPDPVTAGEVLWFRVRYGYGTTSAASNLIEFQNSAGQPFLAMRCTTSGVAGMYYNSGTGGSPVWTQTGSNFTIGNNGNFAQYLDFRLVLGSPHSIEFYIDNELVATASGTFTQAAFTEVAAVLMKGGNGNDYYATEIMATVGICTINGHVYYGKPNAAGSNSAMTGAYTAIDDVTPSDSDLISSATAGQRSTFNYANHPALAAGFALGPIVLATRARNNETAPTQFKPVRRIDGVDEVGAATTTVSAGFNNFIHRYDSISVEQYNAIEFGAESSA